MAKSGGATEATTLIFPKQSDWKEIAEAKRTAKKRAQSANGTYSTALADKVENAHMDRRAARLVLALDAIEDDEDLHVTVHHMVDGMKKLGILKRAMAQEEMFDEHKIDDAALTQAATKGARAAKGARGKKGSNVVPIGDAARQVSEKAGLAEAAE